MTKYQPFFRAEFPPVCQLLQGDVLDGTLPEQHDAEGVRPVEFVRIPFIHDLYPGLSECNGKNTERVVLGDEAKWQDGKKVKACPGPETTLQPLSNSLVQGRLHPLPSS